MTISTYNLRFKIFVLLICCLPLVLTAQPRVYTARTPAWIDAPTQLDVTLGARQVSEGYYLKLYDYQIHAEKQVYYTHIVREIVSEAGVQSGSEIWVNFSPSYQKLSFHDISVVRNGKRISRLDLNNFKVIAIEEEASSFVYNGDYSAYSVLDDIRVGDRIEYSYSITGDNPVFQGKFFEDIYLQIGTPISQLYISVSMSDQRNIQMKTFNGADEPKTSVNQGLKKLVWRDQNVRPPKFENYAPVWYDYFRHVQLSEYLDWHEVAAWARFINPIPDAIHGELLEKANQLIQESKGDQKVFAHKAIQFVQDDIRYTGIEIGEYSHRANQPEKVLKQRYGDCKDKSLLLATLLTQAGIEADVVLMHTLLGYRIRDQLPSPAAFNHAIVYFYIDDRPYYVDPTISYQGGRLETRSFPYSASGLLSKKADAPLVPIGYNQKGDIESVETYEIAEGDSTLATLHVETEYTGWQADKIRSQLAYSSIQGLESNYLDYYSRLYPEIEIVDSLQVLDERLENKIIIKENYKVREFLTKNERTNRYEAAFFASMIANQFPDISSKRKTPIAVNFPTDIEYTIRVISPRGWHVPKSNFFLDRNSYLFGSSAKSSGDTLILNYQFLYHSPVVAPDKSGEFATDIAAFQNKHLSM